MPRVKIQLADNIKRVVVVDTEATRGATIGTNVYNADGSLYVPASGGGSGNFRAGYGILFSGGAQKTISVNRAADFAWQGQHSWEKPLWVPHGTAALPAVAWADDPDTGPYRVGADNYGISAGGALRWDVNTARTYQTVMLQARVADGYIARLENLANPDAGLRVYTKYNTLGTDTYLDFHETATQYFRLGNRGEPANNAHFELSRFGSIASIDGTIFTVARESEGIDFLEQARVANGSVGAPSLAFTNAPLLGAYADPSAERMFINIPSELGTTGAFTVTANLASSFARVQAWNRNTGGNARAGFQCIVGSDSTSTVAQFAYYQGGGTYDGWVVAPFAALTSNSGIVFSPDSAGVVTGSLIPWRMPTSGNLIGKDSIELQLGTGADLRLFHNGTNSTIRNDTGDLSFLAGTTEVARINATTPRFRLLNGTAAAPALGWFSDPDNGLYYITTNSFGISTAGTLRYQFGAAGQLGIGGATYGTADTQAIVSGGASAAPSWQTVCVDGQTQTLGGAKTWSADARFNALVGFNNTAPIAKPTVSGSRADPEAALANLLTALANYGLITNSTTA